MSEQIKTQQNQENPEASKWLVGPGDINAGRVNAEVAEQVAYAMKPGEDAAAFYGAESRRKQALLERVHQDAADMLASRPAGEALPNGYTSLEAKVGDLNESIFRSEEAKYAYKSTAEEAYKDAMAAIENSKN